MNVFIKNNLTFTRLRYFSSNKSLKNSEERREVEIENDFFDFIPVSEASEFCKLRGGGINCSRL